MQTEKAVTRYLESLKGLSDGSLKVYTAHLCKFKAAFVELPGGEIPGDQDDIERSLLRASKSKASRIAMRRTIGRMFEYLVAQDEIAESPIPRAKVGRPRKPARAPAQPALRRPDAEPWRIEDGPDHPQVVKTAAAIDDFMQDRSGLRPKTLDWYRTHFAQFLAAFPGELPMLPGPIQRHIDTMTSSLEWKKTRHQILRTLYKRLADLRRLPADRYGVVNPMVNVRQPKVDKNKPPATLDPDEIVAVIAALERPIERAVFQVLADTGLRVGELLSITRERVHEDSVTVSGKTGEKDLPISPEIRDLLLQLVPSGPVFISPKTHKLYTISGIYQLLRDVFDRAGIEGKRHMGPHMIRHTFARRWIAAGGDVISLRDQLGHSDVSTTQRYAKLEKADLKQKHRQFSLFQQVKGDFGGNGDGAEAGETRTDDVRDELLDPPASGSIVEAKSPKPGKTARTDDVRDELADDELQAEKLTTSGIAH